MKLDIRLVTSPRQREQLRGLVDVARRAMAGTAEDLEELIEASVAKHSKTGALFASITKRREGDGWFIGHDGQRAPHWPFVHWGTRPHVIVPNKRKILRWPAGSGYAFARKVNHPGYAGDAWLVRAAAQAPAIFSRHVDRLLAGRATATT